MKTLCQPGPEIDKARGRSPPANDSVWQAARPVETLRIDFGLTFHPARTWRAPVSRSIWQSGVAWSSRVFWPERIKRRRDQCFRSYVSLRESVPSLSRARAGKRRPRPRDIRRGIPREKPRRRGSPDSTTPRRRAATWRADGAWSRSARGSSARHCREDHDVTLVRDRVIVRSLRGGRPRYFNADDRQRTIARRPPVRGPLARCYVPDSDRCTEILIQFGTSFERPVRQPAGKGNDGTGNEGGAENSWPGTEESSGTARKEECCVRWARRCEVGVMRVPRPSRRSVIASRGIVTRRHRAASSYVGDLAARCVADDGMRHVGRLGLPLRGRHDVWIDGGNVVKSERARTFERALGTGSHLERWRCVLYRRKRYI